MADVAKNLYILHGPHWQLPIYAETMDGDMVRVKAACSGYLTPTMRDALYDKFHELGHFNGQNWFFTRETFARYTSWADHQECRHAYDYISWVRPIKGAPASVPLPDANEMDEFYEEFANNGWAPSPGAAQVWYGAWVKHIFHWLMVRRRPVDLGFCVLEPLPVRNNWLDIMRWRMAASLFGSMSGGLIKAGHVDRSVRLPFRQILAKAKTFIVDGCILMAHKRILLWSITVRHKRPWWRALLRLEALRRRHRGLDNYYTDAIRFLESREKNVVACLIDFVAQARRPFVQFRNGAVVRSKREVSKPHLERVENYLKYRRSTVALDLRTGRKGQPKVVDGKNKGVRKLLNLRKRLEDLRQVGAFLDTAGRWRIAADGLPVLDPSQGPVEGCPMLAEGSNGRGDEQLAGVNQPCTTPECAPYRVQNAASTPTDGYGEPAN